MPERDLRTHYYRGRADDAGEQLLQLLKKNPSFRLVHYDKSRGELTLEYKNGWGLTHDLVVTIYAINPIRIAVDIHTAIRGRMFDFGWNRKIVRLIYQHLDHTLVKDQVT